MPSTNLLTLLLVCFITIGNAQNIVPLEIPFTAYGEQLEFATAGGLNAPQFSHADLNDDGIQDMYIFDRTGNVHITFINEGIENAPSYRYAPQYARNFPDSLTVFSLLRDFNNDGAADIFAFSVRVGVPGIAVYEGYYNSANELDFNLLHDVLFYPGLTNNLPVNLAVLNSDIPDINDIDGDGDMDILTFDLGGSNVEWFRNYSVEQGYGLDSLLFRLEDPCWGDFYEGGLSSEIFLSEAQGVCANGLQEPDAADRHAGSTILSLDFNNDGARELLLGDLASYHIAWLHNAGTNLDAFMDVKDITFPSYNTPVDIPIFLGSFSVDVNNDGLLDLVFAPNNKVSIKDTENVWYYRNTTSNEFPEFELQQKDLFVGKMVDIGTSSNPAFMDINGDGLLDLVVGNNSKFLPYGDKDPRLFLFYNVGTATEPAFELVDENWLDFNQYAGSTHYFSPTFGDLDGDGDKDLLVGDRWGGLFYVENEVDAGAGFVPGPIQPSYQELDVRNIARPTIYDYNQDGLMDIIVGEKNGILNYFQNIGSVGNPLFDTDLAAEVNSPLLGQVNTRDLGFLAGNSAPNFISVENETILVCGSEKGIIKVYDNIGTSTDVIFNKVTNAYGNLHLGSSTALAIEDINNDNYYDLVVGNNRGGLNVYTTDWRIEPVSTTEVDLDVLDLTITPNPSQTMCVLSWEKQATTQVQIHNQMGQLILNKKLNSNMLELNTSNFAKGVYFVEIQTNEGKGVEKLVVL